MLFCNTLNYFQGSGPVFDFEEVKSGAAEQLRVLKLGFQDFGNDTTPIPSFERSSQEKQESAC